MHRRILLYNISVNIFLFLSCFCACAQSLLSTDDIRVHFYELDFNSNRSSVFLVELDCLSDDKRIRYDRLTLSGYKAINFQRNFDYLCGENQETVREVFVLPESAAEKVVEADLVLLYCEDTYCSFRVMKESIKRDTIERISVDDLSRAISSSSQGEDLEAFFFRQRNEGHVFFHVNNIGGTSTRCAFFLNDHSATILNWRCYRHGDFFIVSCLEKEDCLLPDGLDSIQGSLQYEKKVFSVITKNSIQSDIRGKGYINQNFMFPSAVFLFFLWGLIISLSPCCLASATYKMRFAHTLSRVYKYFLCNLFVSFLFFFFLFKSLEVYKGFILSFFSHPIFLFFLFVLFCIFWVQSFKFLLQRDYCSLQIRQGSFLFDFFLVPFFTVCASVLCFFPVFISLIKVYLETDVSNVFMLSFAVTMGYISPIFIFCINRKLLFNIKFFSCISFFLNSFFTGYLIYALLNIHRSFFYLAIVFFVVFLWTAIIRKSMIPILSERNSCCILLLGVISIIFSYMLFSWNSNVLKDSELSINLFEDFIEAEEEPFFVYFTASWCYICTINDIRLFRKDRIKQDLADRGLKMFVFDMTHYDFSKDKYNTFQYYGTLGVPVYALHKKGGVVEVIQPMLFTYSSFLKKIDDIIAK